MQKFCDFEWSQRTHFGAFISEIACTFGNLQKVIFENLVPKALLSWWGSHYPKAPFPWLVAESPKLTFFVF